MTRDVEESEEKTPEEAVLQQASEELAQVQERIGPHFRRAEPRSRVGRAPLRVARSSGTQKWRASGRGTRENVTRTGPSACWPKPTHDEEAVRDELRSYVVEHLGEADGVLVVDETGFREIGQAIGRRGQAVQRSSGWTGQ
jgi:hypothetical protein